jgi:ATP-dependent Clp protease ATP-binding subunit ClpC
LRFLGIQEATTVNTGNRNELKVLVERVVRPVRATMARKRRMREELLAHAVSAFEEETQRTADEQAALDAARRRFGDPGELSAELQRSVPRRDRAEYWNEKMLQCQPGEALLHFAARLLLLTLAVYCLMLPAVLAIGIAGQRPQHLGLLV